MTKYLKYKVCFFNGRILTLLLTQKKLFRKVGDRKILNDTTFKDRNRDGKSTNQQIVTPLTEHI